MTIEDYKDNIIAYLQYGRSKRRGTIYQLRTQHFKEIKAPVFFLSTGRTGTKWFAGLLKKQKDLLVFHAPKPDLSVQSVYAYELFKKNNFNISEEQKTLLKEVFLAGREQNLRYSYKTQKRYVETNNYVTFFAPILAELFPDAYFVHIYRHPGEFVRSGLSRNYYNEKEEHSIRRIKGQDLKWEGYSQFQKNCWLWNETNLFVETFKEKIDKSRIISFKFENLNADNVLKLFNDMNISFPPRKIEKHLHNKRNIQKNKTLSAYTDWDIETKNALKDICGDLVDKYNFKIH